MPITFGWYNEAKHIWIQEFSNYWTMEEFWVAADEAYKAIDAIAPHKFYIISDMTSSMRLPPGLLSATRSILQRKRNNEALHVLVGGGVIIHSLYQMARPATKQYLRLANTLEEALAMIDEAIAQDQVGSSG
ncbi:MAG: hypothetical protein NZ750_11000 [Anaerolineae bacterium]|nr:hypothetical protein [Anaerolineae bacterium]MDW8171591.1 hypothetical protein [Anaerolineae bacterium]